MSLSSTNPFAAPIMEQMEQLAAPDISLPLNKLGKIRLLLVCANFAFVMNWVLFFIAVAYPFGGHSRFADNLFGLSLFASWLIVTALACFAYNGFGGVVTAALYWIPLVGLILHLAIAERSYKTLGKHGYKGVVFPRLSPQAQAKVEKGFDLNTVKVTRSFKSFAILWTFILSLFSAAMYLNFGL